jgi:hypothetical protein
MRLSGASVAAAFLAPTVTAFTLKSDICAPPDAHHQALQYVYVFGYTQGDGLGRTHHGAPTTALARGADLGRTSV